jgi:putative addiction module CopG family antidote
VNIALTHHFEKLIASLIKSGRYNNASEVVRAGLRTLEEKETPVFRPGSLRHLYTQSENAAERKTARASVTKVEAW